MSDAASELCHKDSPMAARGVLSAVASLSGGFCLHAALSRSDSQLLNAKEASADDSLRVNLIQKFPYLPLHNPPSLATKSDSGASISLKHVSVIGRHGARTPIGSLPGFDLTTDDPVEWHCTASTDGSQRREDKGASTERGSRKPFRGNCEVGQLTKLGELQMEEIGRRYRDHYITKLGFLPESYQPNLVYVRATHVVRALISAQKLMEGMYPYNYRPQNGVPIYQKIAAEENMYPRGGCQRLTQLVRAARHSPVLKERSEGPIRAEIGKAMNMASTEGNWKPSDLANTFDMLLIHNHALPGTVDVPLVDKTRDELQWYFGHKFGGEEMSALTVGRFIGEVTARMQESLAGAGPKFALYLGHDTTLGPVALALGFKPWFPPGANFFFFLPEFLHVILCYLI
eukprot:TRINITY_DN2901_c0_g1_i2.p1 TRINITY_DN2901_c0_g1~~TRINITY_DN2901_c0_g1_i2.p1  ORF type:complete len:401 (+),score=35.68 TRINITY_DN2901_c0_g1_i2:76-1278(+)